MARAMKDSGIEWIEEIPDKWKIVKLKSLFTFGKGLPITKDNLIDKGIPVISYGQIHSKLTNGVEIQPHLLRFVSEEYLLSNPQSLVHNGDFIFADTSEDLEGCGNAVYVDIDDNLFAGYHTIILFNKAPYFNKYLAYLFRTSAWRSQLRSKVWGIKVYSISRKILGEATCIIPIIEDAKQITAYLDKKCATIDSIIEKTRTSIEEYKKLKQAIITQAVTKGIRPDRPMKDSGIEWIGEIPADWDVKRIKTIFRLRDERNFLPLEEVNLISLYTDLGVVQHCDLEKTTGNKASNADGYKKVYENDIIVNIILCWMGAIGRSAYTGITSPAYDIYIPSNEIECRFYHHYFRTTGFSGDCYKRGKGIMAMRWRTYSDQFRDIKVVVPPIEEQREILKYLDDKTAEIDRLISKKEEFLSEMEEYKKSLIYEYVTGKKEVPA